jgi:YbbR domain-containing protein
VNWLQTFGLRLILAFTLSFAVWVFVSYTQNPDRRIRFDNVPVDVEALGPGLIVVDTNGLPRTTRPTVSVTVEGSADMLQNVTERDLRAFQDLASVAPGQYVLDVQVEPTRTDRPRLQFAPDPFRLPIRVEQEITSTLPLSVTVSGSVPFSFEALEPQVTSRGLAITNVQVQGPQNRVERVVGVRAAADIDRLTSTYNSPRSLEAVDRDGRAVDGVTIEPPLVNVQIPINSSVGVKRVPVVPQLAGQPASGYVVAEVSVDPQLVTLTGSSGPLDNVESISTTAVSLTGATRTFSQTVLLQEPQSARLSFGEPAQAVVTVRVVPLDQTFKVTLPLPVQVVGAEGGVLVSLSPAAVPFTLEGRSQALARLDTTTLVGTVSVRGLGPGVYSLTPELALPADIRLAGPPPQVTVTLRLPATATPEATATAEPGETVTVEPEPTASPTATAVITATTATTSTTSVP